MAFGGLQYVESLGVAFALSAGLTPLMRRLALGRSIVDAPDGGRKQQEQAVPYMGGVAITLSVAIVLVVGVAVGGMNGQEWALLGGVLGPALAMALVGFVDDMRGLTPGVRFVAQSLAAVVTAGAMALAGTRTQLTGVVLVDSALTILWVIGITNALNLLDNMDGLAGGAAAIASLGYFAMAALNGQYLIAALALALAGACLGFLVWNWNPARIYMGDAGALFVGFLLAAVSIRINLVGQPREMALLAPLMVLLLPVLDTSLVVISRLSRGVSPFQGGRDHLSHRLLARGLTVRQAAGTLYTAGALAAIGAIAMSRLGSAVGAGLAGALALAFLLILIGALRSERIPGN